MEGESADSYISTGTNSGTLSESHTEENVDWSFEDERHLSLIQECLEETDRTASIETMLKSREGSWNDKFKGNFSIRSLHKTNDSSTMTSSMNDSVFKTFNKSSIDGTYIKDSALKIGNTFTISSSADATYTVDSTLNRKKSLLSETYDKVKTEENNDITLHSSRDRSLSWELTPGFAKSTSAKSPKKIIENVPKQPLIFNSVNNVAADEASLNTSSIKYLDKSPTETQYYDITDSDVTPPLSRKHLHSNTSPRDPARLLSREYLSTPNESVPEIVCHGSILETMYYDLSDTDMIPSNKLQKNSINSVAFSPLEALPMLNEIELSNSLLRQRLSLSNTTLTPLNSPGYFNRFQNVTCTRPKYNLNDDNSLLNWTPLESSAHRTGTWLDEHVFVTSPNDSMIKELYNSKSRKSTVDSSNSQLMQCKSQLHVPGWISRLDGSLTKHRAKIPLDCAGGILCRVASFSSLDLSMNGSHLSLNMPEELNKSVANTPTSKLNIDRGQNNKGSLNEDQINEGKLKKDKNEPETISNYSQQLHVNIEKDDLKKFDKAENNNLCKTSKGFHNSVEVPFSPLQKNRYDELDIDRDKRHSGSSECMPLEISTYLLSSEKIDRLLTLESSADEYLSKFDCQTKRKTLSPYVNKENVISPFNTSSHSELGCDQSLIIIPREGPSITNRGSTLNTNFPYSSPRFPRSLSVQELLPRQMEVSLPTSCTTNVEGVTPKPKIYRKYRSTGNVHTPHSCTYTPTLKPVNKVETPNPYHPKPSGRKPSPRRSLNTACNFLTETAL